MSGCAPSKSCTTPQVEHPHNLSADSAPQNLYFYYLSADLA
eukprot:CAMPEP_0183438262 /NCGR_PEP_ID=MMETSP0370-20130417/76952_1 /TAXON_ID=268820 /ORGANISM="Peridinium aciculiferum, Strain PAER-2" /LENGTH=40 /DNA_ID= /DNA_START= /DNA_END= /DNA_ORIENTATION=